MIEPQPYCAREGLRRASEIVNLVMLEKSSHEKNSFCMGRGAIISLEKTMVQELNALFSYLNVSMQMCRTWIIK
jgi:hypothetical protein